MAVLLTSSSPTAAEEAECDGGSVNWDEAIEECWEYLGTVLPSSGVWFDDGDADIGNIVCEGSVSEGTEPPEGMPEFILWWLVWQIGRTLGTVADELGTGPMTYDGLSLGGFGSPGPGPTWAQWQYSCDVDVTATVSSGGWLGGPAPRTVEALSPAGTPIATCEYQPLVDEAGCVLVFTPAAGTGGSGVHYQGTDPEHAAAHDNPPPTTLEDVCVPIGTTIVNRPTHAGANHAWAASSTLEDAGASEACLPDVSFSWPTSSVTGP